jgi:ribosome maturation factor RimP
MITNEKLATLANEYIEELEGVFLVEASVKGSDGSTKVTVLLDGDEGVDIDQCAIVSRQLGNYLEENELFEEKYRLEVSSAGVDYPLKFSRQYVKNIGRDLSIQLINGEEIKGKLIEVGEESFIIHELIEVPKKANKYIEEDVAITFESINKTKVLISFN